MKNLFASILMLTLAACSTTPNFDSRFGAAVRDTRFAMTINPGAGAIPDHAAGLDGAAAREAMLRYQDSFKAPPPVVNVINIGNTNAK
ncbi:MAG: hypothetical protein ACJ8HI_00670 [Massilia sp.]